MHRAGGRVDTSGSTGHIAPAERRTWEDRFAVRFPRGYRRVIARSSKWYEGLRPEHPARRAIAERIISRSFGAFNRNDVDALLTLYHPQCVWDWSHYEGWPEAPVYRGREGVERAWLVFSEAWGDFRFEPSDFRDFGARTMTTCHLLATGSGSGVGVERTWWQVGYARDGLVALVANYSDQQKAVEAAQRP